MPEPGPTLDECKLRSELTLDTRTPSPSGNLACLYLWERLISSSKHGRVRTYNKDITDGA